MVSMKAPAHCRGRRGGQYDSCQPKAEPYRGQRAAWAALCLAIPLLLGSIAFVGAAAEAAETVPAVQTQALPFALVATRFPKVTGEVTLAADPLGLLRPNFGKGAAIVFFPGPGQSGRYLAEGFYCSADPEVSFDGKQILFAGKRNASDRWAIYEVTISSGQIRRVTDRRGDCRSPSYQGLMYTITEESPWRQITFVETDERTLNEFGGAPRAAIYSCKLDGSFSQRLTYNLSSDFDLVVMPDGRLVFASWQRSNFSGGPAGRITLLGVNTDGIDFAPFCGDVGRRIKLMPCVTAHGSTVFVESDTVTWDGAGTLSSVSLRRPLHSYRPITQTADGLFHSPSRLPDGRILVSRRAADGSTPHAVYAMELISKRLELVIEESGFHWIQAKAVAPREEPDGRSSVLTPEDPLGKFYCLDVYQTEFKDPTWLPRGAVRKIRFVEGVPRTADDHSLHRCSPPLGARRILGEVEPAPDGSFNVEVPANLPIQIQLVDDRGVVLRNCAWIWTRNHAAQGCIGCHEDPELTPINRVPDAVTANSIPLYPAVEQRRTVDFRREVFPVIAKKCAGCHGTDGSPPRLDNSAEAAYEALLAQEPGGASAAPRWKYVHPGQSRTSPLAWHVFSVNTSRPWDGSVAKQAVKPIPHDKAASISAEDAAVLARWIDLGAPW